MIRIFNSAYRDTEHRFLSMEEVNVVTMRMDMFGKPYIFFEHKDYPPGALRAKFDGEFWVCDLD